MNIDGLPVAGRIVGVLRRFPTLAPDAPGFVVADEATLASALDASLPGQGRPDELWIDTPRPHEAERRLRSPPFAALGTSFRATVQRALRTEPIAVGTLGTLAAAAGLAAALALVGLLAALVGALREPRRTTRPGGAGTGSTSPAQRAAVALSRSPAGSASWPGSRWRRP